MRDIALKLRYLRLEQGLTQAQLAQLSRVHDKTISAFETGLRIDRIRLDQIERILTALKVPLSDFFAWEMTAGERQAAVTGWVVRRAS